MPAFKDFNIGTRLAIGFGLVICMMMALVAISLERLAEVGQVNTQMIEQDWVKAEAANAINATTRANGRLTMELLMAVDGSQTARIKADIERNKTTISNALETLERLVHRPEGKALLATLKLRRTAYVQSFTKVLAQMDAGQKDAATVTMNTETLPALDALQEPINALTDLEKSIVVAASAKVDSGIHSASLWIALLGGVGLLMGLVFSWLTSRSITGPIRQAVQVARSVAAGDLTTAIPAHAKDECGMLLDSLQAMTVSLSTTVGQVRVGADSMATATSEIADGNMDLSSRTEEQASALEETAASMEQLAAAVKSNYEGSRHANQLAETAAGAAARGGEVVSKVVHTMEAINDSSRKISDIIGVIDGIAFQTNILALNAAVEAARAGEQGRGFAVVASEVRSLAGRSAAAAKEIAALIHTSVGNVDEGCKLVEQAGSTMDEIVVHVRRVADLMGEITNATQEQTTGIEQVNQAIGQMDQVTQQNAALVEEAAAASQALEEQAKGLVEAVRIFKTANPSSTGAAAGHGLSAHSHQRAKAFTRTTTAPKFPAFAAPDLPR